MRNQQEAAFEKLAALGQTTETLAEYLGLTDRQVRRYRTGETLLPLDIANGLLAHPDSRIGDVLDELVHHRTNRMGLTLACEDRPTADATIHAAQGLHRLADFLTQRARHAADGRIEEDEHEEEVETIRDVLRVLHCLHHDLRAAGFAHRSKAKPLSAETARLTG